MSVVQLTNICIHTIRYYIVSFPKTPRALACPTRATSLKRPRDQFERRHRTPRATNRGGGETTTPTAVREPRNADCSPVGAYNLLAYIKMTARDGEEETPDGARSGLGGRGKLHFWSGTSRWSQPTHSSIWTGCRTDRMATGHHTVQTHRRRENDGGAPVKSWGGKERMSRYPDCSTAQ